jgi:lipid-A-disaccharide synthase-like uncharacterized protein
VNFENVHLDFWKVFWNLIGWTGQGLFFSRIVVQWYAAEKKKEVVVPALFWWLSIAGSLLLLLFAVFYDKHYVIIFSYAFSWIPYIRNLVIHYRHKEAHLDCSNCKRSCPPESKFCSECGTRIAVGTPVAPH